MRVVGRCVATLGVIWLGAGVLALGQASVQTVEEAARLAQQARELAAAGNYREGLPVSERAVALYDTLGLSSDPQTAAALMSLGTHQYYAGNRAAAAVSFERALSIREKIPGIDPLEIAETLGSLANARRATGDLVRAEELFARCLTLQEKALGSNDLVVASTLISYGSLLDARGDRARAESMLERAVRVFEANKATDTIEFAQLLGNLGQMYSRSGAFDKARPALERSLAIREKRFGDVTPMPTQLAVGVASLAALYQEMGQFDLAEPLHRRVLAWAEVSLSPTHPTVATVLTNLAMIRMLRNDPTESEAFFLRAVEIREKVLGARHVDVASTLEKLAVLYERDRAPEGGACRARTFDQHPRAEPPGRAGERIRAAAARVHDDGAREHGYRAVDAAVDTRKRRSRRIRDGGPGAAPQGSCARCDGDCHGAVAKDSHAGGCEAARPTRRQPVATRHAGDCSPRGTGKGSRRKNTRARGRDRSTGSRAQRAQPRGPGRTAPRRG